MENMIQNRIKIERLKKLGSLINSRFENLPRMGQNAKEQILRQYAFINCLNSHEYDEMVKYIAELIKC